MEAFQFVLRSMGKMLFGSDGVLVAVPRVATGKDSPPCPPRIQFLSYIHGLTSCVMSLQSPSSPATLATTPYLWPLTASTPLTPTLLPEQPLSSSKSFQSVNCHLILLLCTAGSDPHFMEKDNLTLELLSVDSGCPSLNLK